MVASERCIPIRRPVESVADVLESHTQIIRNLWALEPKAPKSRVRWVLLVAILAVAGVLALDGSVREVARTGLVAATARIAELRHREAPAPAMVASAPVVAAAAPVVAPVVAVASAPVVAAEPAPAAAPPAKKAAARRHAKK